MGASTIAALIGISPSPAITDGSSLSVKSVKGSYGCRSLANFVNVPISTFGVPVNPPGIPFVLLSRLALDGSGKFTSQQFNTGFFTCDLAGNGTYTVNSDGTGTISGTLVPLHGSDPNCSAANVSSLPGGTNINQILLIGTDHKQLSVVDSSGFSIQCTKQWLPRLWFVFDSVGQDKWLQ
jgi:hypothetical protein